MNSLSIIGTIITITIVVLLASSIIIITKKDHRYRIALFIIFLVVASIALSGYYFQNPRLVTSLVAVAKVRDGEPEYCIIVDRPQNKVLISTPKATNYDIASFIENNNWELVNQDIEEYFFETDEGNIISCKPQRHKTYSVWQFKQ